MNAQLPSIAGSGNAHAMRQFLAYVTFGVVYYILAAYAVSLPFPAKLPALIWPGHGIAFGMLLVVPVRWPTFGLVALATIAVGFDLHAGFQRVAACVSVNVAQPLSRPPYVRL